MLFLMKSASTEGRTIRVAPGRLQLAHDLLSVIDYTVQRLAFDENGFKVWPPPGTYFDDQGLYTQRRLSLIEKGEEIDNRFMKSAISKAAGAGQFANPNGFAVLNGLVIISVGKHETR
jgi:hypothetical protein